jgi:hypothetical protein
MGHANAQAEWPKWEKLVCGALHLTFMVKKNCDEQYKKVFKKNWVQLFKRCLAKSTVGDDSSAKQNISKDQICRAVIPKTFMKKVL